MKIFYFLILMFGYSFGANYNVDIVNSKVEFKVKHMLFSTVNGSFKKFHGSYTFDNDIQQFSQMIGSVETRTISTKSDKRDNFIKSVDFFDIAKYPKITMKLLEHHEDKIVVALTIKDITKKIEMQIKKLQETGFKLYGEIHRKDFKLEFKKLKKLGGLTVGNKVKITLYIQGILVD